jgi:hypothetical protein
LDLWKGGRVTIITHPGRRQPQDSSDHSFWAVGIPLHTFWAEEHRPVLPEIHGRGAELTGFAFCYVGDILTSISFNSTWSSSDFNSMFWYLTWRNVRLAKERLISSDSTSLLRELLPSLNMWRQTTDPAATGQKAAQEFPGLSEYLQAVYPGSSANSTATHRRAAGRHGLFMDAGNEPQLQPHQSNNLWSGDTHTSRSRRRLVPGCRCQQHSHGGCAAVAVPVHLEAPRLFLQEFGLYAAEVFSI